MELISQTMLILWPNDYGLYNMAGNVSNGLWMFTVLYLT